MSMSTLTPPPAHWIRPREHTLEALEVSDIRSIEQFAFEATSSFALMQKAGLRSAQKIIEHVLHSSQQDVHFVVFAGPGNNGGDACVVAAELHRQGASVELIQCKLGKPGSEDRARAELLCHELSVPETSAEQFIFQRKSVVIDGLLGIGSKSTHNAQQLIDLIEQINTNHKVSYVFSLDAPSGLDCDTGLSLGHTVRADTTLTYIACKLGLLSGEGKDYAGDILIEPLNCEEWITEQQQAKTTPTVQVPSDNGQIISLPKRTHAQHKGDFGAVGVIGGDAGMTGAAILTSRSALRMGAGRVAYSLISELDLHTPDSRKKGFTPFLDIQYPELMNKPFLTNLEFASVLAVGPGMGESEQAKQTLMDVFQFNRQAMVLDADALNLLAQHADLQNALRTARSEHASALVLTPHPLEAARLLNCSTEQVQAHRFACVQKLATRFQCVVILKGAGTLIGSPAKTEINLTGGPLLATAGSGDVLTGCVAAFLAQGMEAFEAASLSVWLHGLACEPLADEKYAPRVGNASLIIDRMNSHLNQLSHKRAGSNRELSGTF